MIRNIANLPFVSRSPRCAWMVAITPWNNLSPDHSFTTVWWAWLTKHGASSHQVVLATNDRGNKRHFCVSGAYGKI